MKLDPLLVQEVAKELYIRSLKKLPDDVKNGIDQLKHRESNSTAKTILGTMVTNIAVAEQNDNLLCQDTGTK